MSTTEERYEVKKIVRPRRGWAVIAVNGDERRMVGPLYSTKRDALAQLPKEIA